MKLISLKYQNGGLLFLLCLSMCLSRLNAQVPFTYLGINQGLSNNSVRCILRDHKGFMWFGTFDGLNRYDGYSFKVFRNKVNDSTSLINSFVNTFCEDRKGNLWVGTRKGVSVYNSITDKFRQVSMTGGSGSILSDVVKSIASDSLNNVFIGTENTGLLWGKNGEAKTIQVRLNTGAKQFVLYGVQVIKVSPDKRVWVFVQNRGLCQLDYSTMSLKLVNADVQSASSLEADDKTVWIGTAKGLYEYNIASGICRKVNNRLFSEERVMSVALIEKHSLWVGVVGDGIYTWNASTNKEEHLVAGDSKYSLSSGDVYTVFEDKSRRKWIGTSKGGINIIDPQKQKFHTISHDPGIMNEFKGNSVSFLYETADSLLWIATDGRGINIWNPKTNSFKNIAHNRNDINSLPSDAVTSVKSDPDNNIWVATFTSGIIKLSGAKSSGKRYQCLNPFTGLNNPVVYVLYFDKKNVLWATTLRQGNNYGALYYYNGLSDRFDAFDTGLSDLFVLNEDAQGNFWGGNLTQLIQIDRAGKKHLFFTLNYAVRAIHEDRKGNFWVGTEGGGLILFDRKKGKVSGRYTTEEGLCNNSVLNILEDKSGNLWMSTLNGLSKFDPLTLTFKNYFYNDGLQSNQFNYNAAIVLRSGEFAFGGIKGLNLFRPDQILPATTFPPIEISGIKVNNKPVFAGSPYVTSLAADRIGELEIPYNEAVLSFDFAALEYSAPEKISYAYYMEGLDRNWNTCGNLRTANYTHLPEGHYTFHVKNTNVDGVWENKDVSIRIVVLAPWYRTWWAYLFYVAVVVLLLYVYLVYKARQTRLQYDISLANITIEKEKAEKEKHRAEYEKEKAIGETERIINEKEKELNEKKLSFFTNISHEFRTPLTLIINPIKELLQNKAILKKDNDLGTVYRNARRMLSLVDQLLLFRKAESGIEDLRIARLNFYHLCHEVYLCFTQQAKAKNIEYQFICNNEHLEIYADREKLEIILYNLISNALKYTQKNGKVEMLIEERENFVEVFIKDDGAGIPPEAGENLFTKFYQVNSKGPAKIPGFGIGLYLVKHFTNAHKGEISYESKPGAGTSFCLRLQKGHEQFDPALIIEDSQDGNMLLQEIALDDNLDENPAEQSFPITNRENIVTEKQIVLVVDDDQEIRKYLAKMFGQYFIVYEAVDGERGLSMAREFQPDIIVSDIKMRELSGIEFCKIVKADPVLNHIPVILITGTSSEEIKLEGYKGGADDYITKPFDVELLMTRVNNLLKNKNNLRRYFYNVITHNNQNLKISEEYKNFLERCIIIVEAHLDEDDFNIKSFATEIGMSHSVVYRKIKAISGQSLNGFIRSIRLRKAARLLIDTNQNVSEVAAQVGMYDAKHFRENFNKVFGMNPSEYVKKYRNPFANKFNVNKENTDNDDEQLDETE
ncbi:MAG: two-component regulator propeller domain-containing protein [Ferruginibacter sp.]